MSKRAEREREEAQSRMEAEATERFVFREGSIDERIEELWDEIRGCRRDVEETAEALKRHVFWWFMVALLAMAVNFAYLAR